MLGGVEGELHDLLGSQPARAWTRVYLLIEEVDERALWRPAYRSFSAWLNDLARREGVSPSLLWHRRSAGNFYARWAEATPGAPPIAEVEVGEDSVELVRKIAKADPDGADKLMGDVVAGQVGTAELRRRWRAARRASPEETHEPAPEVGKIVASARTRTLRVADDATFEAVLRALEAAGLYQR